MLTDQQQGFISLSQKPTKGFATSSWAFLLLVKWPIIRGPAPAWVSAVKLWKVCESNQAGGGENAVAAQQAQSSCLCTDDIILALAVLYYWLPAPVLVVEISTGGQEKCLRQLTSTSDSNQIC